MFNSGKGPEGRSILPAKALKRLSFLSISLFLFQLCLGLINLPVAIEAAAPQSIVIPPAIFVDSGKSENIRIARPALPRRTPGVGGASIQVTYNGFTPQAQAAFQFAVDTWAGLISSSVPIRVTASFSPLGTGVLGQAGPTTAYINFPNAPFSDTYYAKAVANSLAGTDLDSTVADINAQFSSTASWYFGTDGNTPSNLTDFSSVVLHELGHGLGFLATMSYTSSSGKGNWGLGGLPIIYDRFIVNGSNQSLIDTNLFPKNSTTLGNQLISNNLFFNGSNAKAANGGANVKLYAPNPYLSGSSISHLDYNTFAGTKNALMVYALSKGVSIHDPGPVTLGMFQDMGWKLATFPPADPTGLSATPVSNKQINLSWQDNSTNEYGFKIERKTGAGGTYAEIATVSQDTTSYSDKNNLAPSTTYFYRVRAYNEVGTSAYTNEASTTTGPATPTNLTVTSFAATSIALGWTDSDPGVVGYSLERSTNGGPYTVIQANLPASPNSFTDAGLTAGTAYSYHLRAFSNIGGNRVYSEYSNIAAATTTGTYVVKNNLDRGDTLDQDTADTLSFALKRATAGQAITFALNSGPTLTVTGALKSTNPGVTIGGTCGPNGPNIIILNTSANIFDGITLGGGSILEGVKITGFKGKQLKLNGNGNRTVCVVAAR